MLFVNEQLLNMQNTNDPYVKEYNEGKNYILKHYKFPLVFREPHGIRYNKTGVTEPSAPKSIPLRAVSDDPNLGRTVWRYSQGLGNRQKKRLFFDGSIHIQKNQIELAWFLLFKSSAVKSGMIKFVDRAKEAQSKILAKSKMIATRFLLFDESSPYYNSEDVLRNVALSFGISNAGSKDLSLDEVKLKLEETIENAEINNDSTRNEKSFKEALENDNIVKQKAAIQEAIDLGLVKYDEKSQSWMLCDKTGEPVDKLLFVPYTEASLRLDKFVKFLINNPEFRDMIENALNKVGVFTKDETHTREEILTMKYPDLAKIAHRMDIPHIGKKQPDLQKEVLEALGL